MGVKNTAFWEGFEDPRYPTRFFLLTKNIRYLTVENHRWGFPILLQAMEKVSAQYGLQSGFQEGEKSNDQNFNNVTLSE